jgi:hypothetical protein
VENFNGRFQPRLFDRRYAWPGDLRRELARLQEAVNTQHVHPRLEGRTPAQHRRGLRPRKPPASFVVPTEQLPLAAGRRPRETDDRCGGRMRSRPGLGRSHRAGRSLRPGLERPGRLRGAGPGVIRHGGRHARVCGRSHSIPRRRDAPRRTSGCDLTRMCHRDPGRDRTEQVVVMAVAAAGLVADLEAVGQRLEEPHHLVDGADLGAADDRPGLAEDADRDPLVVEIETDGEQGCLLKSLDLGTAATGFQVTRLTEASFIVSTPKPFGAKHRTDP